MHIFSIIAGVWLVFLVLLDAFETVVLPRRIRRVFRLTTMFYRNTWRPWSRIARLIKSPSIRESFLGYFGPLSLIFLLALWAFGLIIAFALLHWGSGQHVQLSGEPVNFWTLIYLSGETFFTLGLGDVLPMSGSERAMTVFEGGMGFAFLGLVVGYLPTIYSSFSRREVEISLLDARAGSPPTAAELLARLGGCHDGRGLDSILQSWERWSAEVLESHISYPTLSFFRSQHSNQSWLGALTVILDTCALLMVEIEGVRDEQAELTFAMARHALVDLTGVFRASYDPHAPNRLPDDELIRLREYLKKEELHLKDGSEAEQKLKELRLMYEPYAQAMARTLLIDLPPWIHPQRKKDNWEAGPWDRLIQAHGLGEINIPHKVSDDF
ncbi:MAG TPA: potassium channel family protein [Terriglobales bacterium]|nr:potassium channel family protein [Terriglobales bacterium]